MTAKKTDVKTDAPDMSPSEQAAGATARYDAETVNQNTGAPDAVPLEDLQQQALSDGKKRQNMVDEDKYGQPLAPTEASTVTLESKPSTAVIPAATPIAVTGAVLPPNPEDVAVIPPAPPMGFKAPVQDERNALEQSALRSEIAERNRPDEAEELKK